jgi:arylsulfatase A-like enzyme
LAELLKPLGYAAGQFGKNHLGDKNEYLPTVHGFDEFNGNLYHLNAGAGELQLPAGWRRLNLAMGAVIFS